MRKKAKQPYLACHNGRKCTMYKKLDKPKKYSFLSCIFNKVSVSLNKVSVSLKK